MGRPLVVVGVLCVVASSVFVAAMGELMVAEGMEGYVVLPHAWVLPAFLGGLAVVDLDFAASVAAVLAIINFTQSAAYVRRATRAELQTDGIQALLWGQSALAAAGVCCLWGGMGGRRAGEVYKV
jgi:hypothetical protein